MRYAVAALCLIATPAVAQIDGQDFARIEQGRYLTTLGDCVACHTAPGGKPFAGGRPIETLFGTLIAPNLTPDPATGIGSWTDDEFVRAIREGIGRGGEHLYPALPYVYYTHITRDDALALRAYLATLDPVENRVVSNQLPFPLNVREDMAAWNKLNFTPGEFRPNPAKTAEWNRGAYIVTGLAHCGLCHTPKKMSGGDEASRALQGNALQGWWAPNITNDHRHGLGSWSVEQIAEYLKTGHNEIAAASGPMAEEVEQSSAALTDADLRAIAVYLKDQPGQADDAKVLDHTDPAMQAGRAIYVDTCVACHGPRGAGSAYLFPALARAPTVQQTSAISLIRVVLQGSQSVADAHEVTGAAMPAFGWKLSDGQVADVLTYIRNAWGNAGSAVTAADVGSVRRDLARRAE